MTPQQNRLSPLICRALDVQWMAIVDELPADMRHLMKMPLFSIRPDMADWGRWYGGNARRIELNYNLFVRHPWYAVVDVLKHEMAHQLCEEMRKARGIPDGMESPHGALFHQCCELLHARADASGTFPTLDELVYRDEDDTAEAEGAMSDQARLVVKVRKLLALSSSSNDSEAQAALLKAREIMSKYDLEDAVNQKAADDQTFYTITLGTPQPRISMEASLIASILDEFFNVACLWNWMPNPDNPQKALKVLSVSGRIKHLRIASYTYDCIVNYMNNAEYNLPSKLMVRVLTSTKAKHDFHCGILTGFANALREQHQPPEERAIVLAHRAKLEEYLRYIYPHIYTRTHRSKNSDMELHSAGEEAGRKMNIRPAVETTKRRLLE